MTNNETGTSTELHRSLRELMDRNKISITAVARGIGLSTATISQWLNHKYRGDVKKVEDAVRKFLTLQEERKARQETALCDPGFIKTSVASKVFEVASICHVDSDIGVVCGDSGLGKTTAVKQFAAEHAGVILLEADLGYTARVLFLELHKVLGLDGVGSLHTLFDEAVSKLRGSGRLIIVDEAEHLPYRALEMLRRLYDRAGVGVVLVGMQRLLGNLRGLKGDFAQLYSRVGVKAVLSVLRPTDVEEIVHATLPGSNGIWKAFHEATEGNARVLNKLIKRSAHIAEINGTEITADVIKAAKQTLIG